MCVQPQWCRGFVLLLLLVKAKTPLVATFPSFSPSLPLNPSYPPAPPTISHFLWLTLWSLFSPSFSLSTAAFLFLISSHLHTQLFPLTVELLQLLLQQSRVACRDVLGQVRLHGGQVSQSTGQTLQRELGLLHNTHTYTLTPAQRAMYKLSTHAAVPLSRSDCPD